MSKIKVGDKVYCCDYYTDQRLACYVKGLVVINIENDRVFFAEYPEYSHALGMLTTIEGYVTNPYEYMENTLINLGFDLADEDGCFTMPDGTCVSKGPCIHAKNENL